MSMWRTLGIKPTSDLSTIKKAYAKKLKVHHPEDDPAGFQRLKEAYDSAIRYSKNMSRKVQAEEESISTNEYEHSVGEATSSNPVETIQPLFGNAFGRNSFSYQQFNQQSMGDYLENEAPSTSLFNVENPSPNLPFNWEKANEEFLNQMSLLYDNFFERIKLENWAELLNRDVMWDIENRRIVEPLIMEFLSSHYYLPQDVLKLFDQIFNLRERATELQEEYNIPFAKHVLRLLNKPFPLSYAYMSEVENQQYDKYLELKETVGYFLDINNSKAAEHNLIQAKKLCKSDPDLIRMEGIISFRARKFDQALELFNQALSINPMDLEGLYLRAYISYIRRLFKNSLEDLNKVLNVLPNHGDSLVLAAKCRLALKDTFEAKALVLRALNVIPQDSNARETLSQVNQKLKFRFWLMLLLKPWEFGKTARQLILLYDPYSRPSISKAVFTLLGKILKWSLYAALFLAILAVAFATRVGGIILIIGLIRYFSSNKHKP